LARYVTLSWSIHYFNWITRYLIMRRQKRDKLGRAHSNDYQVGLGGKSKEHCPYQGIDTKSQWLGGWREAVTDRNMGRYK